MGGGDGGGGVSLLSHFVLPVTGVFVATFLAKFILSDLRVIVSG